MNDPIRNHSCLGKGNHLAPASGIASLHRAWQQFVSAPCFAFRRLTLLLAGCLLWSFALAPCAIAASTKFTPLVAVQPMTLLEMQKLGQAAKQAAQRPAQLQERIKEAQVPKPLHLTLPKDKGDVVPGAQPRPIAASSPAWTSPSLLDEVGLLAHPVAPAQMVAWKTELKTTHPPAARVALLHLWLGEYELAQNEQPHLARWHWRIVQRLTQPKEPLYGLAAFDGAMALYDEGAYAEATDEFKLLLAPKTALGGYNRDRCALWLRHAGACAGYHDDHARIGIPEPPRLDPLCGAAALAACLQALSLPGDKKTVLAACHITGEGSSLADIVAAQQRLGVSIRSLTADDEGLMSLPKPLVAYVEHDHFVAVVRADKNGVAYLCSDCGPWPGGQVDLTWKQWHTMNAGAYAAVTKHGSYWDRVLQAKEADTNSPIRVASRLPSLFPGLSRPLSPLLSSLPALRGVRLDLNGNRFRVCTSRFDSDRCPEVKICCKKDKGGPHKGGDDPGQTSGVAMTSAMSGPSEGDPVNLATGEEEYEPPVDMTVYNPHGPSIRWKRIYDSLGNETGGDGGNPDGLPYNVGQQNTDYGNGWSQTYNVGVLDSGATKYVVFANGSRISFAAPASSPSSGTPSVSCPVEPGVAMLAECDADSSSAGSHFTITFGDRTRWVMSSAPTAQGFYPLAQIADRNGNAISFQYIQFSGKTLLSAITDASSNKMLLTVMRDGFGRIAAISDCYGRSVYYHVGSYYSYAENGDELDEVSQIVPTGTPNPPDRYLYGYQLLNGLGTLYAGAGAQALSLHTITVPSPTGTGQSTATINYNQEYEYVSSIVDANGNSRSYTSVDALGQPAYPSTHTLVTVKDPQGNIAYSYMASYDNNMSPTGETNGAGNTISSLTYDSTSPDPYRPTVVTDGNSHVSQYTWDRYGNLRQEISSRGTISNYIYGFPDNNSGSSTNYVYKEDAFELGELLSRKIGSETATTYFYYEPSGLIQMVASPNPGTSGSSDMVQTSYTYDSLGNLLTVVAPGNNAVSISTTTFNYTDDGAYHQSASIGQVVSESNTLGQTMHFRYDNRGNVVIKVDEIGNETDSSYNIADQLLASTYAATGTSGTGHAVTSSTYLYTGGPKLTDASYDENANLIRQISYNYGPEDELLYQFGSCQPYTVAYDALYRIIAFTDGNGQTTHYNFNTAGYLASIVYPGNDNVQFPSYDNIGHALQRIDGRGIVTNFVYNDAQNRLTDIIYPATGTLNVHFAYDGYNRLASMFDATGNTLYSYDDDNNQTSITTNYNSLTPKTIGYTYYSNGSRASMTTPAGSFSYGYDGNGRLISLQNPYGEITTWSYLNNGWIENQATGSIISTLYSFNARGFLLDLKNVRNDGSGTVLSEIANTQFDGIGNVISSNTMLATSTNFSGTTTYTYDNKNQVTNELSSRAGGYTYDYGYDAAGNATTFRNNSANSFNSNSQITNPGYTYDGNGNPITYKNHTLGFDPENRLISYDNSFAAGYKGDDLRAWKQSSAGTTYFLYDGMHPICELNTSGQVMAVNTFSPHGLISRHDAQGSIFYAGDAQGNVIQRLSDSGTVLANQLFDAFGKKMSDGTSNDPFCGYEGMLGYYFDNETGLELLTYRYYDPDTGRFLNRDPESYNGGANVYEYAGNSPINGSDPSGLGGSFGHGGNCFGKEVLQGCAAAIAGAIVHDGGVNGCADASACIGAILSCVIEQVLEDNVECVWCRIPQLRECVAAGLATAISCFGDAICECITSGSQPNLNPTSIECLIAKCGIAGMRSCLLAMLVDTLCPNGVTPSCHHQLDLAEAFIDSALRGWECQE